MKLKVIVNTAPLIFLAKVGKLEILKGLFQDVYITRGVMDEVEKPLRLGIVSPEISSIMEANWIKVIKLKWEDELTARNLGARLGIARGEAGVAVLYQKLKANLLIVADRRAERKLRTLGINVMDVLDIGFEAARKGLLDIKEFAKALWIAGYRTERVERVLSS